MTGDLRERIRQARSEKVRRLYALDQRLLGGSCCECGTIESSYTNGCGSCHNRAYGRLRRGKLTREEFDRLWRAT